MQERYYYQGPPESWLESNGKKLRRSRVACTALLSSKCLQVFNSPFPTAQTGSQSEAVISARNIAPPEKGRLRFMSCIQTRIGLKIISFK